MKHLILLRHAKSSWVNPDVDDFDRPLNKRGKRSARALGKWFHTTGWKPDRILCSAARRTRETWEHLGLDGTPDLRRDLYLAAPDDILTAIQGIEADTALLIAHNPGIASLAHTLVDSPPQHPRFNDFPTGSLLVLDFDVKKFSKIRERSGTATEFLTPQDLVDTAE